MGRWHIVVNARADILSITDVRGAISAGSLVLYLRANGHTNNAYNGW